MVFRCFAVFPALACLAVMGSAASAQTIELS